MRKILKFILLFFSIIFLSFGGAFLFLGLYLEELSKKLGNGESKD
jgi:hypothetical protein